MTKSDRSFKRLMERLIVSEYFILILSALYFVVIGIFRPAMFRFNTITNIISNMWPLLAVCLGQTFVLLLGGIDLSQTAVISFCSMVTGVLLGSKFEAIKFGKSPLFGSLLKESGGVLSDLPDVAGTMLTVLIVLAIGAFIGWINGMFVAKLDMPPFMITLISEMIWSGLALWFVYSQNCTGINASFNKLGTGKIGPIPIPFLVLLLLLLVCEFILSRTIFGRWIYSVGANGRASVISGIPRSRVIIFVYSVSGFCAAVGSIIYTARQQMGRPTLGEGMLNDVLGATVIGGTSMYGGKGRAIWSFYGVIFYCIMTTSLNMLHLNSFIVQAIKGCVILFAVSLDIVRTTIQKRMTV